MQLSSDFFIRAAMPKIMKRNTKGMHDRNRSRISRIFSLNIGTIVFGILFVYIILSVIMYITAVHVKSYRVSSGPLAKNQTYTGVAVYSEEIVNADATGYIDYYAQDGARIRSGGVIYGVSPDQKAKTSAVPDADTLKAIRSDMEAFSQLFDPGDFHDVYSLKYQIEGELLNLSLKDNAVNVTGAMTLGNETIYTSGSDGVICYSADGCEGIGTRQITSDIFDEKSYHMTSLKTDRQISAGDPVYRIIKSEDWSLLIPLTAKQIVHLSDISRVRVKFLKDGVTQNAAFTILTTADGTYYGKLDFSSGMIRYLDNRYIDIELVTNNEVGLKIPVSSIVTKKFFTVPEEYAVSGDGRQIGFLKLTQSKNGGSEPVFTPATVYDYKNGLYYVDDSALTNGDIIVRDGSVTERYIVRDTAELEGVYSMNKGYAIFRRINIIDKNEDYCIVEKGTSYGISQFDNIVENAANVKESQITAG